MAWLAAFSFAVLSFVAALGTYFLTSNIEPQPEYPRLMSATLRLIGTGIAVAGVVFAAVLLSYAGIAYFGLG